MKRLAVLACVAIGCGHAETSTLRWTYTEDAQPIASVDVYEVLQDNARVGIMIRGFEKRLQEGMGSCGLQVAVHHGTPTGEPTRARLTLEPNGGEVTPVMKVNQYGAPIDGIPTYRVDGAFKLEVFDPRANKVTWRIVVDVKTESTPTTQDGTAFAELVLAQLQKDRLLRCERT